MDKHSRIELREVEGGGDEGGRQMCEGSRAADRGESKSARQEAKRQTMVGGLM